jgi:hypothetical protein
MNLFKRSFVWQFAAGFALGAVGLAAVHAAPAHATAAPTQQVAR